MLGDYRHRIRLRAATLLRRAATRVAPKTIGFSYEGIGSSELPRKSRRALVFGDIAGVQRYVEGRWPHDPVFKRHTIKGDTVSIVRALNARGFIVDYCDVWKHSGEFIDWSRYALVVDNLDNLKYVNPDAPTVKIFFSNFNHWLINNGRELQRIEWFRERTGVTVPSNRTMTPFLSDVFADFQVHYGNEFLVRHYSPTSVKIAVELCALCGVAPAYRRKDVSVARNSFLWLGGGGMLYKGLDIAMEAFSRMPEMKLLIGGNLQEESEFWKWAEPFIARNSNISHLGWQDTTSEEFNAVADSCIAVVYPSSTEGGPSSVARCLFNGCIPIVTEAANVRAEQLGFRIVGNSAEELINSVVAQVRHVSSLPDAELRERADACRNFAEEHHTREAFDRSFSALLERALA